MKTRLSIFLATIVSMYIIAVAISSCNKQSTPITPVNSKIRAWVVGNQDVTAYGMILYTEDGGETWVRQGLGSPALKGIDVQNLYFIDAANVWAVCTQNVIIRTTDGGQTWNQVPTPKNLANPLISSISSADNRTIWVSGDRGVVYKYDLINNLSCTAMDSNIFHEGFLQGIHAVTPDIIYTVGENKTYTRGFIAITRNAGASWDTISPPDDYNQWKWIGVKSTSADNVIIYGQLGHYTISQDNGLTWKNDSVMKSGCQSQDMNCLVMVSPLIFWCAGDNFVLKTTDAGGTWRTQTSQSKPFSPYQQGIDAINDQTAIITWLSEWPFSGAIQKTTDGGINWTLKVYDPNTQLLKVSYVH